MTLFFKIAKELIALHFQTVRDTAVANDHSVVGHLTRNQHLSGDKRQQEGRFLDAFKLLEGSESDVENEALLKRELLKLKKWLDVVIQRHHDNSGSTPEALAHGQAIIEIAKKLCGDMNLVDMAYNENDPLTILVEHAIKYCCLKFIESNPSKPASGTTLTGMFTQTLPKEIVSEFELSVAKRELVDKNIKTALGLIRAIREGSSSRMDIELIQMLIRNTIAQNNSIVSNYPVSSEESTASDAQQPIPVKFSPMYFVELSGFMPSGEGDLLDAMETAQRLLENCANPSGQKTLKFTPFAKLCKMFLEGHINTVSLKAVRKDNSVVNQAVRYISWGWLGRDPVLSSSKRSCESVFVKALTQLKTTQDDSANEVAFGALITSLEQDLDGAVGSSTTQSRGKSPRAINQARQIVELCREMCRNVFGEEYNASNDFLNRHFDMGNPLDVYIFQSLVYLCQKRIQTLKEEQSTSWLLKIGKRLASDIWKRRADKVALVKQNLKRALHLSDLLQETNARYSGKSIVNMAIEIILANNHKLCQEKSYGLPGKITFAYIFDVALSFGPKEGLLEKLMKIAQSRMSRTREFSEVAPPTIEMFDVDLPEPSSTTMSPTA